MRSARLRALLALLALVGLVALGSCFAPGGTSTDAAPVSTVTATPTSTQDPETGLRWVDLSTLPRQAQQTVALVERGGPYPYAKDGATFGNREGVLPRRPRGFYREYTVTTPGEGDRGARRIVTGDRDRQFFYTGDHYVSFARIRR